MKILEVINNESNQTSKAHKRHQKYFLTFLQNSNENNTHAKTENLTPPSNKTKPAPPTIKNAQK